MDETINELAQKAFNDPQAAASNFRMNAQEEVLIRKLARAILDDPFDRVFDSHDAELHTTGEPNSGVVTLVIPGIGNLRMSLAKAEDIAGSLKSQAEYGRRAAEIYEQEFPNG